ncbi:unnamed protein product [Linum trigynum]|uniref:Uncharacterized protein n=1 Tax=Linum trigynum TaxID=586398 RepID=A0AAV2DB37_9ROSI
MKPAAETPKARAAPRPARRKSIVVSSRSKKLEADRIPGEPTRSGKKTGNRKGKGAQTDQGREETILACPVAEKGKLDVGDSDAHVFSDGSQSDEDELLFIIKSRNPPNA